MEWLNAFWSSPTGVAVQGLLVGSILVFALGVVAAVKDRTFNWVYVDSFVRSTILGRVLPVLIVLVLGYTSNDQVLTGAGVIAAGAVAAGMIASALTSIQQISQSPATSAASNPPPTA